nr:DUF739 family protein [uncultured Blautia sp.]
MYDYSKLSGRIVEICGTRHNFAKAMNLSERTISLKLCGKIEFKQREIELVCRVLKIRKNEIVDYFFTTNVQSN